MQSCPWESGGTRVEALAAGRGAGVPRGGAASVLRGPARTGGGRKPRRRACKATCEAACAGGTPGLHVDWVPLSPPSRQTGYRPGRRQGGRVPHLIQGARLGSQAGRVPRLIQGARLGSQAGRVPHLAALRLPQARERAAAGRGHAAAPARADGSRQDATAAPCARAPAQGPVGDVVTEAARGLVWVPLSACACACAPIVTPILAHLITIAREGP